MHGSVSPQCQSTPLTLRMMQLQQVCTQGLHSSVLPQCQSTVLILWMMQLQQVCNCAWVCLTTVSEHSLDTVDDAAAAGMHLCMGLSYHSVRAHLRCSAAMQNRSETVKLGLVMQMRQVCTCAWICLTTLSEHTLDTLDDAAAAGMHSRIA